MGFTSTDDERLDVADLATLRPAPLTQARLSSVVGVLGTISMERAADARAMPRQVALGHAPRARGAFRDALTGPGLSVVAEVKRGSPSQGAIRDLDPVETALAYQRGGAAAVSVLTEPRHFRGALEHLEQVSAASTLPAMRKDFVVHPVHVEEAARAGAKAVLAIVAVMGDALGGYVTYAHAMGLDVLVEVHDEAELEIALAAGADILGVNNRDLRTLEIDLDTAPTLIDRARAAGFDGVAVAESGYDDAASLRAVVGLADAALIGTSLARRGDPEAALSALLHDVRAIERGHDLGRHR